MSQLAVACTNGLKGLLAAVEGDLRARTGLAFSIEWGSTKKLLDDISAGFAPDLAIASAEAIDALHAQGRLAGGRIDIARSVVGVAVRKGMPHPDIRTTAAFWQTLREAPSISRSRLGMSGQHLAKLIDRFGLGDELNHKIKIYDAFAGQACANGEVEIAVQQISELLPVAGLEIVGPLPDDIQLVTIFSAGIGAATAHRAAARGFVDYFKSANMAPLLRANGLEPA